MRLDGLGLLIGFRFRLRLAKLLDQTHRLALETAVETTTGACMDDIAELLGGEVEESTQTSIVSDRSERIYFCRSGAEGVMYNGDGSMEGGLTAQARYHGMKTCGRFSSSSALRNNHISLSSLLPAPLRGLSRGFQPWLAPCRVCVEEVRFDGTIHTGSFLGILDSVSMNLQTQTNVRHT